MIVTEIEKRRIELKNLISKRALILCDGHSSRCSVDVMKLGRQHNIDIFIFPSHLTHILQPLDCGINRQFKYEIGTFIKNDENQDLSEKKTAFVQAVCSIIDKTLCMGNILNAWRNSGLIPFDPSRILNGCGPFAPRITAQSARGIEMVFFFFMFEISFVRANRLKRYLENLLFIIN
jgi:hypothetical protein